MSEARIVRVISIWMDPQTKKPYRMVEREGYCWYEVQVYDSTKWKFFEYSLDRDTAYEGVVDV